MGQRDSRVDAYIAKAAPFAQPILTHFRDIVHEACPEIVENVRWGNPNFDHHGVVCGMSAFKAHCTYGFWKASLLDGADPPMRRRVESVDDFPSRRELIRLIKLAAKLNEDGVKAPEQPRARPTEARELEVPDFFKRALRKNKKALASFEGFSYSHKKEYVEWIAEAKTDDTRQRRIEAAIEWMAEGKPRNWKYMRK